MNNLMRWFKDTDAKNVAEQDVLDEVRKLAIWVDDALEESPEKTAGLRKLLEARDAFVRGIAED